MIATVPKMEYSVCDSKDSGIPVIVVAAGMSSRMKGINKQAALLCGVPVLARTLMVFEGCDAVSNIILVVKDEDIFETQLMVQKYSITKISDIVCGGKNRQESVFNGLNRVGTAEKVLIHDGARPLVEEFVILNVIKGLEKYPAVACGIPLKDTIKQIDKNSKIINTPDRSTLAAVQTPQGVKAAEYKSAIEKAGDLSCFTDDLSVMEAAGFESYVVEGSYRNIKITMPEDLRLAEFLIREEAEE